jgi:parallel beta-helix repeat protein
VILGALIGLSCFGFFQILRKGRTITYSPTPIPAHTVSPSPKSTSTFTPVPSATVSENISTLYVSTLGSDNNPGSQEQPLQTIKEAVTRVVTGDTIIVFAGDYPEAISVNTSGIRFIAEGKVSMRGFLVGGNDNLVRGFTITNPSSDFGIRVTGNDNLIENNDISDTGQDGIWFFGSGNKFVGNNIHDIVDRSKITFDPHVDCFQTWGPAENITFEKNICNHTSTYGSNQILMLTNNNPPVRNIVFRNNILVMHDPGYSPMNFVRRDGQEEISEIFIINNTIVHMHGIGNHAIGFRNITGVHAVNNIFIDYGDHNSPYILIEDGSDIYINNNAVYKSDGLLPEGGVLSDDLWMQKLGLVDFTNYDFHLLRSSPLIDSGQVTDLVNDDFDGHPRPFGAGYDIGAFEYSNSP